MRSNRDSWTASGRNSQLQRQNSFLSPITITNPNTNSTIMRRPSLSSRSSLGRSPERTDDRKRKRLSLIISNGGSLGAPRLNDKTNTRRQSRSNNINNLNNNNNNNGINRHLQSNINSSLKNTTTNIPIQKLMHNSIRKTNIPTRRSSTLGSRHGSTQPPSSSGSGNNNQLFISDRPKDQRPIADPTFQAKVRNELYEFLSINNFGLKMKCELSDKILKHPTQKQFSLIFQFLYKKLDPGYEFESFETDVYDLLKFLEYPYFFTIHKSQVSVAGSSSNWPIYLAMLHWLLTLVKESLKITDLDIDSIQESSTLNKNLNNPINDAIISNEQSILNKLFINYALQSYKAFLSEGENDYAVFYNEMQNDYKDFIDEVQRKYNFNLEINQNLQETLNSLNEKSNLFYDEFERSTALKTDVTKFQSYIDTQKQRQTRWPSIIEKAKNDINDIKESIKNINKEKQDIVLDLEKKQLTLKDIEELHKERSKLTLNLNSIDLKQNETKELIDNKLLNLRSEFLDLQSKISVYNNSIYEILNNLNLSITPDSSLIVISSINDELQTSKFGLSPNEIIPILPNLRTSLNNLRSSIQSQILTIQDETLQTQESLDDLKLSIVSYTDKLEELEDSLSKSKKEYSDLNEQYSTDSSNKQMELEERAKEIRLFKLQNMEYKKSVESKWKDTQRNYKKIISGINERRSQLFYDIVQSLDQVVNFKSDIMTDLENAVFEVNQEMKQHISSLTNDLDNKEI
jgi:kinetochore protein NDC80